MNVDNWLMIAIGVLVLAAIITLFLIAGRKRPAVTLDEKPAPTPVEQTSSPVADPVPVAAPEPKAVVPEVAVVPEPEVSPYLPEPQGETDDLTRIKGLGPKIAARLAELGVFHFQQIADWTPEQLAAVDAQLGKFQGRPERDQWQSQARLLASGDVKAYERVHGKLGPQ